MVVVDSGFEYPYELNKKANMKNIKETILKISLNMIWYQKKGVWEDYRGSKKNIDQEETDKNLPKRYLDNWLFAGDEPVEAINLKQRWSLSTLEMWMHLALIDKYHKFAEVAMRLLSIGTSESSVERLISMHRYLVHDRMTNISPETLLARLRLRSMRNDEKNVKYLIIHIGD